MLKIAHQQLILCSFIYLFVQLLSLIYFIAFVNFWWYYYLGHSGDVFAVLSKEKISLIPSTVSLPLVSGQTDVRPPPLSTDPHPPGRPDYRAGCPGLDQWSVVNLLPSW